MRVDFNKKDKSLYFYLDEEIDHHNSEKIRKRADYEIEIHIPKKVIFDFRNVTFMDSSGIGMVIGRYKLVSMFGGKLVIANVNKIIKKTLEMSGILKIINIEENDEIGGDSFEECV